MIIGSFSGKEGMLHINWALTNKCNYTCSYCHDDLNNGSISPLNYDGMFNFIESVFSYGRKVNRKLHFEFGGGEVTYYRGFGDLIRSISEQNGEATIVSNGSKKLSWWKENAKY